ncbi:hypothetical protein DdX_18093 [Ditylenchus destructor]|uniref:Uncharacterized protein n=1 Tax=Ditylenchus destructor TaxID=166010 RepID=A0AAD4QT16_9BILA|nr:hypothetical protein DdX_18093 [Ditylenchus destructor]
MYYSAFLFVFFTLVLNSMAIRHCEGDGKYEDETENNLLGNWQDRCSGLPHNLTMGDDEDVPDSACKRRFCPACVIKFREYCAREDMLHPCSLPCCELESAFRFYSVYGDELCKEMKADCGGLCGQMQNNSQLALDLIVNSQATPYKLCRAIEFC